MSNIRLNFSIILLVLSVPFLKSLKSFQYNKGIYAKTPGLFSKTFTLKQSVEDDDDFESMRSSINNLLLTEVNSNILEVNAVITDNSKQPATSSFKPRTLTAAISIFLGSAIFFFQSTQQVSGVALLKQMEKESIPLQAALCSDKPTVVEFYADWCESCKELAPTVRALEFKFKDNINFVTVNGINPKNAKLVDKFRVDGIPHIAFITKDARVETALIGAVPGKYLQANMDSLVKGVPLPYEGYDAFEEESHYPFDTAAGGSFCSSN